MMLGSPFTEGGPRDLLSDSVFGDTYETLTLVRIFVFTSAFSRGYGSLGRTGVVRTTRNESQSRKGHTAFCRVTSPSSPSSSEHRGSLGSKQYRSRRRRVVRATTGSGDPSWPFGPGHAHVGSITCPRPRQRSFQTRRTPPRIQEQPPPPPPSLSSDPNVPHISTGDTTKVGSFVPSTGSGPLLHVSWIVQKFHCIFEEMSFVLCVHVCVGSSLSQSVFTNLVRDRKLQMWIHDGFMTTLTPALGRPFWYQFGVSRVCTDG